MHIESYREYCLSKKNVTESFPFDDKILVFKVANKMFALANVDEFDSFNVKCDPEEAIELRAKYEAVEPGYHMNKKHWNTVYINRDATEELLLKWIDDSYDLIVKSLPKKVKNEFQW